MNTSSDLHRTQQSFARKAQAEKTHRFEDLWHLLGRDDWIRTALAAVLANTGSRTAGIDGVDKSHLAKEKEQQAFVEELRKELKANSYVPAPVKRIWIPKPGKTEKRPLGIPTFKDRVVQELLRMLLEPIWESDFLNCSNGFRPGRSTHDCIAVCYARIQPQNKYYWIIEGDIRKCFDRIHHDILLRVVQRRIADARIVALIEAFLRSGFMDDGLFAETTEGTPQGGILSPLLANIYLHEFDTWWWERYGRLTRYQRAKRRQEHVGNVILVRYADDFILLANGTHAQARELRDEAGAFLRDTLRLELSPEKTRITHATKGFTFLGFAVRWRTPRNNTPWLCITPTPVNVNRFRGAIRHMTARSLEWESVAEKIRALNRVSRGWGNYYRHVTSSRIRQKLDWWVSVRMLKWLGERHKGMGKRALLARYLIQERTRRNWGVKELDGTVYLALLRDIAYAPFRPRRIPHPYLAADGADALSTSTNTPHVATWDGRMSKKKALWEEVRTQALARDGWRCVRCGSTDQLEVHHLKPSTRLALAHLQTLCFQCHVLTPSFGRNRRQQSNSHSGEPDASKGARPVRRGG